MSSVPLRVALSLLLAVAGALVGVSAATASELPALALTGARDAALPVLGALGLLQSGVALLALAAMLRFTPKRRRF